MFVELVVFLLFVEITNVFDDEPIDDPPQVLVLCVEKLHQEHDHTVGLDQALASGSEEMQDDLEAEVRMQGVLEAIDELHEVLDIEDHVGLVENGHF